MQIMQASVHDIPERLCPDGCVVTIGNFDGVHLGHRALIRTADQLAGELQVPLLIVTFPPRQGVDAENIYTEEQKRTLLEETAPEAVLLEVSFDDDLRTMPEEVFFGEILRDKLQAKGIVVGTNFRYGFRAAGDVKSMEQHCRKNGMVFKALEGVTCKALDGTMQIISSTLVRSLLSEGKVEEANRLLGRPYYTEGTVLQGKHLGRTIGFPTINLMQKEGMAGLLHGVYVTRVETHAGTYFGMTNVGFNPTVEHGHRTKIETHILDFAGDLYDQSVRVGFLAFLRAEQRFSGIDALKEQLKQDISQTRAWVSANHSSSAISEII